MRTPPKMLAALTVLSLVAALPATGGAGIVAQEDYESGTASGWTDNTVTDSGHADFTQFLGRFSGTGGSQGVSKTFGLSGIQPSVKVQFDFYQIDSWDNEYFRVYVDDGRVANDQYSHGGLESPPNATPLDTTNADRVFRHWSDQRFRYEFDLPVTDTDVKLGFGSTLNSGISDESWGIDNLVITENEEQVYARLDQARAGEVSGAAYAENVFTGDPAGPAMHE